MTLTRTGLRDTIIDGDGAGVIKDNTSSQEEVNLFPPLFLYIYLIANFISDVQAVARCYAATLP